MITAREAMEQSEFHGRREEYEAARFWMDFARELREEAFARLAWGSMLPVKAKQTDTQVLHVPDDRPGEAIEGDGARCRCGYFLMVQGGQIVHTRTGQMVCPVGRPGPDDTVVHTFATPE